MTPKNKPKLKKDLIWVVKYPGKSNGYGETQQKAYAHFLDNKARSQIQRNQTSAIKLYILSEQKHIESIKALQKEIDRLNEIIRRGAISCIALNDQIEKLRGY